MPKDFLYETKQLEHPLDLIERDIYLYGEEFLKTLDDSEFFFHYGISRNNFLTNYHTDISDLRREKVTRNDKAYPFTEQSLKSLMEGFQENILNHITAPKTTSEKRINNSSTKLKAETRTSVRPSEVKKRKTQRNPQQPRPASKKERKAPYPAPQNKENKNLFEEHAKKEFSFFKKNLFKQLKGPFARKSINLREKAFRNAMLEAGIRWGSPKWAELVEKFFPGAKLKAVAQNEQPEIQNEDQPVAQETESTTTIQGEDSAIPEIQNTTTDTAENRTTQETTEEKSQDAQVENPQQDTASPSQSESTKESLESLAKEMAAGEEEAQQEMAGNMADNAITAGDEFVGELKGQKPTTFLASMKKGSELQTSANESKLEQTNEKIPEVETPTGLEPNQGEALPDRTGQIAELEGESEFKPGTEPSEGSQSVGEQLVTPTRIPNSPLINQTFFLPAGDESTNALAAKDAILSLPTRDDSVNTSPGTAPEVPLSGDADPQQAEEAQAKAQQEAEAKKAQADQASKAEVQFENITPVPDGEILTTELNEMPPPPEIGAELELPTEVSADIQEAFDKNAQAHLDQEAAGEYAKNEQAIADLETESEAEKQNTLDEVDSEAEKTRQEQIAAQGQAQAETDQYREQWQAENDAALQDYEQQAAAEYDVTQSDIDSKVNEANAETQNIYQDAETDAQAEQDQAQQQAEQEQESVEKEEPSFWDKITNAVSNFFDKVKKALNDIFDAMRAAVKAIIDKAKELAAKVIDMARDFIVSAIKMFGEALKAIVNVALAAFPKLAKKFNDLIDKAVNLAVDAVNKLAEGLKAVVNALLDILGAVLDKILAAYQAVLNAILSVLEFITVGLIKIIQGLANLGIAVGLAFYKYFLGAMAEEAIGTDITQPISVEKTDDEIAMEKNQGAAQQPETSSEGNTPEDQQNQEFVNKTELSDSDIEMPEGPGEMSPELFKNLNLSALTGSIDLGFNSTPITREQLQEAVASGGENVDGIADSIAESVVGEQQEQLANNQNEERPNPDWENMNDEEKLNEHLRLMDAEPAAPEGPESAGGEPDTGPAAQSPMDIIMKTDRLSVGQRLSFVGRQMLKGMKMWWQKNQVKIYAAIIGILIGAGVIAFFTGGAGLIAVLQVLLQIMTVYFIADAIIRIKTHFFDYLQKAWNGDAEGGGKSLAKALAILISEFVLEYLLKVVGKVLKKIKAALKGTKRFSRAAKAMTRIGNVVRRVGKGIKNTGVKIKNIILKRGRVIFEGLSKAWTKVINTIGDLRQKILKKFGFKRMWAEKSGKYIEIWAEFNPKIMIMRSSTAQFDELTDDQLRRLRQMDGNTELIGKQIDNGLIVSDDFARRFNAGDVDESFDEMMHMNSDDLRDLTTASSKKSTYQLGKGIEAVDGPIPPGFQRHHVIPEATLNNSELRDFFEDIDFDIQDGKINGVALPSSQEALDDAIKNGFTHQQPTIHMGSHIDDYSDNIIDTALDIKIEYDDLILEKGIDEAKRIAKSRMANLAQTTKNGLLNGTIRLN